MKDQRSKVFPKTSTAYWKGKVFTRGTGELYCVQIGHKGRQERFPLRTANKEAAAAKAKAIYLSLVADGWDATRERFKTWRVGPDAGKVATVGEYLEAAAQVAEIKTATFAIYARKFRRLVAGVIGIEGDRSRYDYVNGGHERWLAKVDGTRLDRITPEKVQKWKKQFVEQHQDPAKRRSATVTLNSVLRGAKALFSARKVLPFVKGLKLPEVLPFDGVANPTVKRPRYRSKVNPSLLLQQARQELGQGSDPGQRRQYLIFLLALGAGLRRAEIDRLTWQHVDFTQGTILIESTADGDTKTESSVGTVMVDPGILGELRKEWNGQDGQCYVITSDVEPKPGSTFAHYRCNADFDGLCKWLREHGVEAQKPLHTLRKEFGSLLAKRYGIFVASDMLRHADIKLTRDYYAAADKGKFLDLDGLAEGAA